MNLHQIHIALICVLSFAIIPVSILCAIYCKRSQFKRLVNVGIILAFASLTGCAWLQTNQPKLQAVGKVALKDIALAAWGMAVSDLQAQVIPGSKPFDLQTSVRQNAASLLTSDKLKEFFDTWNNTSAASLVPPNLTPEAVHQVALTIADSQAVAAIQQP